MPVKPNCLECPLKDCQRVESAPNPHALFALVGEAPGGEEVFHKQYFIGEAGRRVRDACDQLRIPLSALHFNNAVQCRPRFNLSPKQWRKAIECCGERLAKELAGIPWILAAGKRGFHSVTSKWDALFPWLGAPVVGNLPHPTTVIATVHPAFCLRGNPQFWPIFYTHLDRIYGLASGRDRPFKWQTLWYYGKNERKTLDALQRIASARSGTLIGIDIETAGIDPVNCALTAVGVATTKVAVSLVWPPSAHFDTKADSQAALTLIRKILFRKDLPKVAHNGIHDLLGLESHDIPVQGYTTDTIIQHHVAGNTLRHDLGFVAQTEFGCDPWKKHFKVSGDAKGLQRFLTAKKEELTEYNAKDTAILPRLAHTLDKRVRTTFNGPALYAGYHERALIAMEKRRRGIFINQEILATFERKLKRNARDARRQLRLVVQAVKTDGWGPRGDKTWDEFNPASNYQLRQLFFKQLAVLPTNWSATTGEPSLPAQKVKALTINSDRKIAVASRALLRYRKYMKLYTAYIKKLPMSADGKIHPAGKVWGTKTGRWSYEGPSIQVIPPALRGLIKAAPGNWILEADYSQLELRIVALLAGDKKLLQWYADGADVHALNGCMLFGMTLATLPKALRTLAKRFVYGMNYGGADTTIWASLVTDFPNLTLMDVQRCMWRWYQAHPEIKTWQDNMVATAKKHDYVECPLSGRRQYFWGQIEPTKIFNYPIQGTAADLIDRAIGPVFKGLQKLPNSALIMQVHDALVGDVSDPVRGAKLLTKHMEKPVTLDGKSCAFPVDYKVGHTWGDCTSFDTIKEMEVWYEKIKAAA